jgi:hypothetical protein
MKLGKTRPTTGFQVKVEQITQIFNLLVSDYPLLSFNFHSVFVSLH